MMALHLAPLGTGGASIVERKNFNDGPGAMLDDKAPYTGGHGANVYAYNVCNSQFVSVMSKKISTSKSQNFTYKNEKNEDVVVDENWIIHWSARCERKKLNAVLKRKVTYFITKCPLAQQNGIGRIYRSGFR